MKRASDSRPEKPPAWRAVPFALAVALIVLLLVRDCGGPETAPGGDATGGAPATGATGVDAPASASRATPPSTETMRAVTAAVAPLMTGRSTRRPPALVLRHGELVTTHDELPPNRWEGTLDGKSATREGTMLSLRRAAGESLYLAYARDFGPAREVRSARWICDRLGGAAPDVERCAKSLRRARVGDALLAYLPCTDKCPVALLRRDKVAVISIEGITDASPLLVDGRVVLAVTTRWSRHGGSYSGGTMVLISLSGSAPVRGGSIDLDFVDARGEQQVVSRTGNVLVIGREVHFVGLERTVERATNKELSSMPVAKSYRIGPDAAVAPLPASARPIAPAPPIRPPG